MRNKVPLSSLAKILSRGTTAILGGIALVSCGIQTGYTETDGIYYDPNTDKIEQRLAWQEPQEQRPMGSIIEQSQKTEQQQKEKYNQKGWGNQQKIAPSDWGNYVGTQHNYYYNTPSWGHSYYDSFYSPYYFGQYNSYFGNFYSWNMGYTWGSPWRHYRHYTPYHWDYNNYYHSPYYGYYGSYYSPYYGGYYGNYYHPYYGSHYGNYPYYGNYYRVVERRRSTPDNISRGGQNSSWGNAQPTQRSNNEGFSRQSNWGRHPERQQNSQTQRSSNHQQNTYQPSNSGGFRNNGNHGSTGGFGRESSWGNSGGSSNNNGGGFRSR